MEKTTQLELLRRQQNQYVAISGGYGAIREADNDYNDLNRKLILAFHEKHGCAYMGNVNFHGEQNIAVVNGEKSIYEEYTGQKIYNFHCTFVVPTPDKELEQMIRQWNSGKLPLNVSLLDKIMDRIKEIGGMNMIWF